MKRLVTISLVVLIMAISTVAVVRAQDNDPSSNALGLYFELEPYAHCIPYVPYVPVAMYAVFTNPTYAQIFGCEFGFAYEGDLLFLGVNLVCPNMWTDPPQDGFQSVVMGCAVPVPTTPFMVLASFDLLPMSPASFYLQGLPEGPPFMNPVIIVDPSVVEEINVTGGLGNISAQIGGDCEVVDNEKLSWDSIKSLYR